MEKIKVLVVDDSSIMRKLISKIVSDDPSLEVVDTAMDGLFALKKIRKHNPDVVLLDLEMPNMDGVTFLKMRKEFEISTPVIILSSIGKTHPEVIFKTLDMGAADFIVKPSGSISLDIQTLAEEIRSKIHYYSRKTALTDEQKRRIDDKESAFSVSPALTTRYFTSLPEKEKFSNKKSLAEKIDIMSSVKLIAIGISTGGPNALRLILPKFDSIFPVPILIVQHMPPGFTREFARGLNEVCALKVSEAEDGEEIKSGRIYIAPGDKHIVLSSSSGIIRVLHDDSPPLNGHKPSAGMLFNSVNEHFPGSSICVIMTGMGKDGSKEINQASINNAICFAQDEESSVVFGMPKVAIEYGGIDEVISLDKISERIIELVYKINGKK